MSARKIDYDLLRQWWGEGIKISVICARFNASKRQVKYARRRLGLSPRTVTGRPKSKEIGFQGD